MQLSPLRCKNFIKLKVGKNVVIQAKFGETILSACDRALIHFPKKCSNGSCCSCEVRIVSGGDFHNTKVFACRERVIHEMQIEAIPQFQSPEVSRAANNTIHSTILEQLQQQQQQQQQHQLEQSSSIAKMKADGEKYVQSAGVDLKFQDDEEVIDWSTKFGWNDVPHIIKRCMSKYPTIVPADISLKRAGQLVRELKGFQGEMDPSKCTIETILSKWNEAYLDNLEKVTFDNLSSYEP